MYAISLITGLVATYTLAFNHMHHMHNARKKEIDYIANTAITHLQRFKDGTLASHITQMELIPTVGYFNIHRVLTYKAHTESLHGYDVHIQEKKKRNLGLNAIHGATAMARQLSE